MYEVSRTFDWCMGHRIMGHEGRCRRLHGHNYRATVWVKSSRLDDNGFVIDFGELKAVEKWVDEYWDHRVLLFKDDPLVELGENKGVSVVEFEHHPTAERIAEYLARLAVRYLGVSAGSVRVSVEETPRNVAEWRI